MSDRLNRLEGHIRALQTLVANTIIVLGERDPEFVDRLIEQVPGGGSPVHPVQPEPRWSRELQQEYDIAIGKIKRDLSQLQYDLARERE